VLATAPQNSTSGFFERIQLIKLRLRAIRAGVWFKALRRIDRALIDLTIKVARSIRSITLARSILALTRKLEEVMESRLSKALKETGFPLAQKLSFVAQKWGNTSAKSWASDLSFVNFLAVMHINNSKPLIRNMRLSVREYKL
jgi:hypothetical protein